MSKQCGDAEVVGMILISVLALAAIVGVAIALDAWSCHSKWARSGMADISYGPIQGCLVKLPDGRWLPEERIREFDLPRPAQ